MFAVFNKVQQYYSSMNALKLVFSAKAFFKVVVRSAKTQKPLFSWSISTTMFNDMLLHIHTYTLVTVLCFCYIQILSSDW